MMKKIILLLSLCTSILGLSLWLLKKPHPAPMPEARETRPQASPQKYLAPIRENPSEQVPAYVVDITPKNWPHEPESLRRIRSLAESRSITDLLVFLDRDQAPLVQDAAIEALTTLGATEALPQIAALGDSQDEFVSVQVMKSLAKLGAHAAKEEDKLFAIEQLQLIYKQGEGQSVESSKQLHLSHAIEAIAQIPHPRSAEFLIAELKAYQGDPFLQFFIVEGLGRLGDPRALQALEQLSQTIPSIPVPVSDTERSYVALNRAVHEARGRLVH